MAIPPNSHGDLDARLEAILVSLNTLIDLQMQVHHVPVTKALLLVPATAVPCAGWQRVGWFLAGFVVGVAGMILAWSIVHGA